MAQEHKLEIFRGTLKFKSNTQKIWGVLIFLTLVTIVEVVLGIYKPEFLMHSWIAPFEGGLLATLGTLLTIVKAYYITWDFMHMRDETGALRRMVVWTGVFLVCYLIFILLQEGGYIQGVYENGFIKTDF
jgi:cytochrome c oxidase subunit 4